MPHRVERFSSTLKQNLAEILAHQMNNPHLGFIFISQVIVTPDLKTARIVISSLNCASDNHSPEEKKQLLAELSKAKGFIKRELAKRMFLKFVPELIFLNEETVTLNIDRENNEINT